MVFARNEEENRAGPEARMDFDKSSGRLAWTALASNRQVQHFGHPLYSERDEHEIR